MTEVMAQDDTVTALRLRLTSRNYAFTRRRLYSERKAK